MRKFAVFALSIFAVFPAVAGARLPVVNVSAAGVSARNAFGVAPAKQKTQRNIVSRNQTTTAVDVAPVTPTRTVVARVATPVTQTTPRANTSVDGGQLVAHADVLNPHRPVSDLWANGDAPLRMPRPNEFSVMRSDAVLPEEDIDVSPRVATARPVVERTETTDDAMAEIDAHIAKLTELQKRAEKSLAALESLPAQESDKDGCTGSGCAIAQRRESKVSELPKQSVSQRVAINSVTPADTDVDVEQVTENRFARIADDDKDDGVVVRSLRPVAEPRVAVRDDMSGLSPTELRRAFRKTFLSENKHLSTYPVDDRFDVASDMGPTMEGFTARRGLSERSGIRPLEIKLKFRNSDSALTRDNYNLLTEYAGVVVTNPTRAVQISIPQRMTLNSDDRKLTARRLAIVEQVLRDNGVSEQRIMPVLTQREDDNFVMRVISSEEFDTITQQQRDSSGKTIGTKKYRNLTW